MSRRLRVAVDGRVEHGDSDAPFAAFVVGQRLLGDAQLLGQLDLGDALRLAGFGDALPELGIGRLVSAAATAVGPKEEVTASIAAAS